MDPLTQGVFGALFAQTRGQSNYVGKAAIIGAIAGMSPDLDVLIRSANDSLLALEYHRHFTHSLFFIPFGGLICALILHPLLGKRWGARFAQTLLWCVLGVASHGLLDSMTSYGTQLLQPFSNKRIAWDIVSIIDPLVTLPLLACILLSAFKNTRRYTMIAIAWITLYFGFSFYQQQNALAAGEKLAQSRGLNLQKIEAKPSFANIFVWKVIATTQDAYYVDAVKPGWGEPVIWEGDSVQKLSVKEDLSWLDEDSQQRRDVERFRWFSQGYLALDQDAPNRVVDMRYSLLPHHIKPLWGIQLSRYADQHQHVRFYSERGDSKAAFKELWGMLKQ